MQLSGRVVVAVFSFSMDLWCMMCAMLCRILCGVQHAFVMLDASIIKND